MTNSTTVSNLLWQTNTVNAQGKLLTAQMGNGIVITNTYDSFGFPTEFKHNKGTANIVTQTTTFDPIYGNLTSRSNNLFGVWNETLTYDTADRLTSYNDVSGIQNQTYNDNGTIATNNIGNYAYTINGKPYTVSTITPVDQTPTSVVLNYYNNRKQNITYNLHKSPVAITEQNKENIDFEYNDNKSRSVMYYGNLQATKNLRLMRKFYSADGTMEIKRNTANASNDFVIYIGGDGYSAPVILKNDGVTAITAASFFYLHRDYQETIIAITNSTGVIVEKRLFDVWGSLIKYANSSGVTTVPTTTTGLFIDRGYTGHEHLLGVGLINMNGRIYDNKLHRFLQPDNNIQDPYNTQNYNRYGYVMNNPTKYTDKSGEWLEYLFAALFNSYASGVQASNGQLNPFKWDSTAWTNAALGVVSSVATQVATNSYNSYVDNYGEKPKFNNFGSGNAVEEHEHIDDFSFSDYRSMLRNDNDFRGPNFSNDLSSYDSGLWEFTNDFSKIPLVLSQKKIGYKYDKWDDRYLESNMLNYVSGELIGRIPGGKYGLNASQKKLLGVTAATLGQLNFQTRNVHLKVETVSWYGTFKHNIFTGKITSVNHIKTVSSTGYSLDGSFVQERIYYPVNQKGLIINTLTIGSFSTISNPVPKIGYNLYN